MEIFGIFFTEMFIVQSSTFHMSFVQIGVFIGCRGGKKGQFFKKMFKNLVLRKHMEDEAETWHTCLGYYPLQKICFLFRSDKNSGCFGNLKFP